ASGAGVHQCGGDRWGKRALAQSKRGTKITLIWGGYNAPGANDGSVDRERARRRIPRRAYSRGRSRCRFRRRRAWRIASSCATVANGGTRRTRSRSGRRTCHGSVHAAKELCGEGEGGVEPSQNGARSRLVMNLISGTSFRLRRSSFVINKSAPVDAAQAS